MKVIVVGAGPAGIRAALRARELGAQVTLLESTRLGGMAFNGGPAPMRALARAARWRADSASFATLGLEAAAPAVNFKAAIANANRIAAQANEIWHITTRIRETGIEVIDAAGPARFVDQMTLEVGGRPLEADRILLAVGGQPRKLRIRGHELALSVHDLCSLQALPRRVTVVGGAAAGCQLASIVRDLGAHVDLIEFAERLMPKCDIDVSHALRAAFADRGMNILLATRAQAITAENGHLSVTCQRGRQQKSLATDAVFSMVGWPANLASLELDIAGIATRGPYIRVDEYLRTSVPEIFAIGDANGISMLAQSAALQGSIAAENAVLGPQRIYTPQVVASACFTNPEHAAVGMTEEQARANHDCVVGAVRYGMLPRAILDARTDGMCKLIVDRATRTLLGAHVLGSCSAEVIQVAATCMAAGMEVTRIADLQLAFPTFSEAVGMAARRIVRKLELEARVSTSDVTTDAQVIPAQRPERPTPFVRERRKRLPWLKVPPGVRTPAAVVADPK